jgi:multidrug efflux pump subunit AcrA (membrane-fusion protein)
MKAGWRRQGGVAALVLAAGAVVAALIVFLRSTPDEREAPPQAPRVRTAPAELRHGALTVTGTGTVRALAEVAVAAQVGGRADWVHPQLVSGGRVARGEVLVRIDAADYRNRVRQARAGVQQAEVDLQRTREEARLARREFERFSKRRGSDSDSGATGDESRFLPPPALTAPAGAASASGPADEAPGTLLLREPQLKAAQAALERARAQLEEAQLALERTAVRAPFDAVVREAMVEPGALVQAGQAMAQLYAAAALEVVVPLPDAAASLVPGLASLGRDGPSPSVTAVLRHGRRAYAWDGALVRLEGGVDERTRTLKAVVRIGRPFNGGRQLKDGAAERDSPAERTGSTPAAANASATGVQGDAPPLLPGQFVEVHIAGRDVGRHFAVPRSALRDGEAAADQVWVVREGRLRKLPVDLLQTVDDIALVMGPLTPGLPVVIGQLRGAVEGMVVRTDAGSGSGSSSDGDADNGSHGGISRNGNRNNNRNDSRATEARR